VATLLIIGASRGIGFETVKAALQAGHSVRALARSARRIPVDHPKLEKMAGDALETATVKRALTGVDVVTQSLGVSAGLESILRPTRFFSKATRVLVTAMERAQVKRLICVTRFGAGDSRGHGGCLYNAAVHLLLGRVYDDTITMVLAALGARSRCRPSTAFIAGSRCRKAPIGTALPSARQANGWLKSADRDGCLSFRVSHSRLIALLVNRRR
jgi:NAD(P)-dependent dehydrogenase (short-subunit alcohol dehydrogenase family)